MIASPAMMEVLFEYDPSEYRCIICTQKAKLCREIEQHLRRTGVADPTVSVLSHTLADRRHARFEERTNFFLQRWDTDWKCYINIDSLEEVAAGDRLTVAARKQEKTMPADHSTDEVRVYSYMHSM